MTADTAPRWYVVIDPKGAANIVSDLAPGPDAVLPGLKPAGRAEPFGRRDYGHAEPGGWRDAGALPTAGSWDRAVAAMNAHNGRVSPYSRFLSPDVPSAGTPPSTRPTADAATDVDARLEDAPGEDDAAAALATARDPESGMTTRQRNRVLAPVGERWCSRCLAALPSTAFGRAGLGYQAWCRTCMNHARSDSRAGGARSASVTTGLTRIPADEMPGAAFAAPAAAAPKPLPAAAPMAERQPTPLPTPDTAISPIAAPVPAEPESSAPAQTPTPAPPLSPTMQTRLVCGCTVTYNCQEAETLRARCTLAQRAVKAERQAGGVSPAATQASADALRAYHAHRGPFVPGGERGA